MLNKKPFWLLIGSIFLFFTPIGFYGGDYWETSMTLVIGGFFIILGFVMGEKLREVE